MTPDHYVELIHKKIDGCISTVEEEDLHQHMARNPEARQMYEDYSALSEMLTAVAQHEVSPNLQKCIMNVVQTHRHSDRKSVV